MDRPIRVAIAGFGKIARDQHLPAIRATEGVAVVATADPHGGADGLPSYPSVEAMLKAEPGIDAVSLCTPPQSRRALAEACLRAGKHVLLEKPPGATVGEVTPLLAMAREAGRSLFAAWHARFAPAVEPARAFVAEHGVRRVEIVWKEDVRRWHPGQAWVWEPGGLGVFDPGINALSILTRVLPRPAFVTSAELSFPEGRQAPIAARLGLSDEAGTAMTADFDWRQTGAQSWDIGFETDAGRLALSEGGSKLGVDGRALVDAPDAEYPTLYAHFRDLISRRESDVDLLPLQLAADAFMLGRRVAVAPFTDG